MRKDGAKVHKIIRRLLQDSTSGIAACGMTVPLLRRKATTRNDLVTCKRCLRAMRKDGAE